MNSAHVIVNAFAGAFAGGGIGVNVGSGTVVDDDVEDEVVVDVVEALPSAFTGEPSFDEQPVNDTAPKTTAQAATAKRCFAMSRSLDEAAAGT